MKSERSEDLEGNEKQIYEKILTDEELSYDEQKYLLFDWGGDGKIADLVDVKRPITNKGLALEVLKRGYISDWYEFSENLRNDKDVIFELLNSIKSIKDDQADLSTYSEIEDILLKEASGTMRNDKEIILKLAEVAPEVTMDVITNRKDIKNAKDVEEYLMKLSEIDILNDKAFLMKLIKTDPYGTVRYFCNANEELRNDKEFASFALDTLESNPDLFEEDEFIEYKGYIYDSIGDKLKTDKEFKDRLEKMKTDIGSDLLDYDTSNSKKR